MEEEVADATVGKRLTAFHLPLDQFFDDVLGAEGGGEEVTEGDDAAGREHDIFVGGCTTDGRFVNADLLGDDGAGEGAEFADAAAEERFLKLGDALADLEEGFAALLDIGNEELGAGGVLADVGTIAIGDGDLGGGAVEGKG